jgi:hypothetical protein
VTSEHAGKIKAFDLFVMMAAAGFIGLSMLLREATLEVAVGAVMCIFFAIQLITHPLVANKQLNRVRRLAWECYSELMNHSLTFRGEEAGNSHAYQQIINSAKHLLNIVQSSREGFKIGDQEYSTDMIKKILSISFSASVVILRTSNLAQQVAGQQGGSSNSTAAAS